jgi:hypothetical protein
VGQLGLHDVLSAAIEEPDAGGPRAEEVEFGARGVERHGSSGVG